LALYLETKPSTVSGWREKNRNPSSDLIVRICEFLDVSYEYLLTGTDSTQNTIKLSANDKELLELFHQLSERQQLKLIGYVERMTEESGSASFSVAADEASHSKTGTDDMGK
jgi:transcriptional regulator with XRE-family HTH domain